MADADPAATEPAAARSLSPGRPPWWQTPRPGSAEFPAEALEGSVPDRVAAVAAQHADRVAIASPTGEITYAELIERVGALAHGIVAEAPEGNVPVAIMYEHDAPLILALLGRTEPALSAMEQHVLRACLRLAGEQLPLLGGLDADFYEALPAFKSRHGVVPADPPLDLTTLTQPASPAAKISRWRCK